MLDWRADIIILTETRLNNRVHWLMHSIRTQLQGYKAYNSSKPVPQDGRACSAGVMICVSESIPMHVVGIYAPEDHETRKRIYSYAAHAIKSAETAGQHLVIGGDFNAVLRPEDRSTGRQALME
ncbi:hypothetical protein TSOC_001779 [Tetrabaena socialis]|uniref:Endonuclease/exonuclease/phosphatase domain-containing protein n=1 Tax=Tetrabaena socialis TaxID=47790 RepID=A0A2J8AFS4_9CHLO|nr:hypothetical protein TSOC_001779 [Tetrabaena socialis]|eukprot:PNH11370.1 hypothetical protein TSOC_001779 [Tetrabaena socialis]